jgi:tight adherence protein B
VALDAARVAQGPGPFAGLVDDLVTAGNRAEPLAPVWQVWGDRLDSDDLRFVARAWELTEHTGSPLADALATSLAVVRARRRAADRVASAAAGPRASMLVLVLLPLSGPFVGLACGIDPRTLYLSSPAATGSLVAGLVLAVLARWWSARILARAA